MSNFIYVLLAILFSFFFKSPRYWIFIFIFCNSIIFKNKINEMLLIKTNNISFVDKIFKMFYNLDWFLL